MFQLTKDQPFDLKKSDGSAANNVLVGAGWDASTEGQTVDLDLAATVFNGTSVVDMLFFGTTNTNADGKKSIAGMFHSGDDLTGEGSDDGPDEEINIDLSGVNGDRVELVLNLYNAGDRNLGIAKNAFVQVSGDVEDARMTITEDMTGHSMHIGTLKKGDTGWVFTPHGTMLGDVDLNGANTALSGA